MFYNPDSGAVGVDGRQSWLTVLDKINNVSFITVLFCDQDKSDLYTDLSFASSGLQDNRIIDLKGEVRARLAAVRQTQKTPSPGVEPWQHYW